MSVFENQPSENPLETLVGEGKKYATVDELAKAYLNADTFISRLTTEQEQLRVELAARQSVEELLNKKNTPAPQPEPEAHQPAKPAALSADELAELVRTEISKTSQEAQTASNVKAVSDKLVEIYGDVAKANEYVKLRAAELGISVELLQDVAAKSPKAFFTTIGLDEKTAAPARPTHGDVNPQAFSANSPGQVKAGTYKFYEQLRKSNPSAYFSPKIQNQMHKEALEKGSSFFE
jgi:hypothetical protein